MQKCPVGIELSPIRMIQRREMKLKMISGIFIKDISERRQITFRKISAASSNYNFLKENDPEKADVLFFAGCMTHLTPAIKNSMIKILDASGVEL